MAFHCCGIDGAHTRDCATGREEEAARLRNAISAAAPSRSYEARAVAAGERLATAMMRIAAALEAMASKERTQEARCDSEKLERRIRSLKGALTRAKRGRR